MQFINVEIFCYVRAKNLHCFTEFFNNIFQQYSLQCLSFHLHRCIAIAWHQFDLFSQTSQAFNYKKTRIAPTGHTQQSMAIELFYPHPG